MFRMPNRLSWSCFLLHVFWWTAIWVRSVEGGNYAPADNADEEALAPNEANDGDIWTLGEAWDIYDFLECETKYHSKNNANINHPNNAYSIHNLTTWTLLRNVYRQVLGDKVSSIPPPQEDELLSAFQVGVRTQISHERGRGNYALGAIPQGTLVWKSTFTAAFDTADQYRQFLHNIPPSLACDVIIWAYIRKLPSGHYVVCTDLDPGSFTNSADTAQEWNLDLGKPGYPDDFRNTGCRLEFYATRDIVKGEELAIDYAFSERNPGWIAMGLRSPDPEEVEQEEVEGDETMEEEDVWKSWSLGGLYTWLECADEIHNVEHSDSFPLHDTSTWELLQAAYRTVVLDRDNDEEEEEYEEDTSSLSSGFQVAYQTIKSKVLDTSDPFRIRRNHANQHIRKGTLVWKSTHTAQFDTAKEFRQFLQSIPPELACEMIPSTYIRTVSSGDSVACLDLDAGTFTSSCDVAGECNLQVAASSDEPAGCQLEFYASRDIVPGEELLVELDFIVSDEDWANFFELTEDEDDSEEEEDYIHSEL